MATSLQLLKHALTSNNYDFLVVQQYLREALHILEEESPAFKRAISAAGAASLLSLSQLQHIYQQASPVCGPYTSRVVPSICSATVQTVSQQTT